MRLINEYNAPHVDDLLKLKDDLGYTGTDMAELAGVVGNSQWRKYTGRENPRAISPHILFYMAAQLALNPDELNRVIEKMRELGAELK